MIWARASLLECGLRLGATTYEADQPPSRSHPDDDTGPLLAPSAMPADRQAVGGPYDDGDGLVAGWWRDEDFKAEHEKQLNNYRNDFEDIRLAAGITGNPLWPNILIRIHSSKETQFAANNKSLDGEIEKDDKYNQSP